MSNIIKFFPKGYKPREMQIEILDKIQEAIKQGNKFIVISSPTGTGKSLFAASLANMSPNPSKKFVKLVDDQLIFKKNATGDFIYSQDALNEPSFGAITLTISKALQDQYDKLFDNSALLKGKKIINVMLMNDLILKLLLACYHLNYLKNVKKIDDVNI